MNRHVAWDFADLEETLRRYLGQPEELERVRCNAYRAVARYYREGKFLWAFANVLEKVGICREEAVPNS